MAGIKLLEKKPEHLNYIIQQLLRPDIRSYFLDDMDGWQDVTMMLYDPRTIVYGIFERGLPVPIGTIFITNAMPFRGGIINGVVFDADKRGQGRVSGLVQSILTDLRTKWNLHYVEARIIGSNPAVEQMLLKLGFSLVGISPESVMVDGKYADVKLYQRIINGENYVSIPL
jgi:RimJ/RimL family protein N-acetyltransferase